MVQIDDGTAARVLPGWIAKASYRTAIDDLEYGNPLILAQPATRSFEEWSRLLDIGIPNVERDRTHLAAHHRSERTLSIRHFAHPLARNVRLAQAFGSTLREAYAGRNPIGPSYVDRLRAKLRAETGTSQASTGADTPGVGGVIAGPSGVGKSHALSLITAAFPQVIEHTAFEGRPLPLRQILYMMLQTPVAGSPVELGYSAVRAFDSIAQTNYSVVFAARLNRLSGALEAFRKMSDKQFVGLFVFDEFQNIELANSLNRRKLTSFLKSFTNETGISLLLAGTGRTRELVADALHGARRMTGVGRLDFPRFLQGREWDSFTKGLFTLQYLREPVEWTPEWAALLFRLTAGVTDLAVKLFIMTQRRVLLNGKERITFMFMEREARESFKLVRPYLDEFAAHPKDPMYEPDSQGFRRAIMAIDPANVEAPPLPTSGGRAKKSMQIPDPGADAQFLATEQTAVATADDQEASGPETAVVESGLGQTVGDIVAAALAEGLTAEEGLARAGLA